MFIVGNDKHGFDHTSTKPLNSHNCASFKSLISVKFDKKLFCFCFNFVCESKRKLRPTQGELKELKKIRASSNEFQLKVKLKILYYVMQSRQR